MPFGPIGIKMELWFSDFKVLCREVFCWFVRPPVEFGTKDSQNQYVAGDKSEEMESDQNGNKWYNVM